MSNQVEVVMTAQDAQAVQAWMRARQSIDAYNASLGKIDATQQKNAQSAREAARAEQEINQIRGQILRGLRDNESAAEKYARQLDELQRVDAAGKLSAQEFARAYELIKKEFKESDPAIAAATRRQQELAKAIQQVSSANQTAQDRYRAAVARLNELRAAGMSQDDFNKALRRERELLLQNSGHLDKKRAAVEKLKQTEAELATHQKRVLDSLMTSQDRHNRQLELLNTLRQKNKLTEQQYAQAVANAKGELESAGSTGISMAGRMGLALSGIGIATGTIAAVAAQVRREYDNLISRQKTAADSQRDVAAVQREALFNIGQDPELTPTIAEARVKAISSGTGTDPRDIWSAISAGASFKGDLSNSKMLTAIEASAKANPFSGESIQKNTIASMQLMKRDPNVTAEQAMGFIFAAKQASPTISDQAFAESVVPSITGGQAFGDSARQAAALNAAIGSSIGDTEGRVSATASTQLAKQLMEAMPKVDGGTAARLEALQTPEFAGVKRKLLGVFGGYAKTKGDEGLTGEAKAFTTLIELVKGGDNRSSQMYRDALTKIPEIGDAAPAFKSAVDQVNAVPLQKNAAKTTPVRGETTLDR